MDNNINNVLLVEDTSTDLNYNILSNIKFDLDLFTFIFVVYFIYIFSLTTYIYTQCIHH